MPLERAHDYQRNDGMDTIRADALPFGLAIAARVPVITEHVDLRALVFDDDQQIMLIRDNGSEMLTPWFKHSDGQTTTNSNTDGAGGRETDEDWTED